MTKYDILFGSQTLLVIERTTDLVVKFKPDGTTEIQVWRTRDYLLGEDTIKSDPQYCTVITPAVLTKVEFGHTGLMASQALAILDVMAHQNCSLPVNALPDTLEVDGIPDGVAIRLKELTQLESTAQVRADELRTASVESVEAMSLITERLIRAEAETADRMVELDGEIALATAQLEAKKEGVIAIETEIEGANLTLKILRDAIAMKSEESTKAQESLAETLTSLDLAQSLEGLREALREEGKALAGATESRKKAEEQAARRSVELQDEITDLERQIQARKVDLAELSQ